MAASSSPSGSSAGRCRRASSPASRRASARRPRAASSPAIPLSDFRATLYDGSFHPVDSNELSFKIAASMALKDGVHNAKPALLEPIMAVEIRVPEAYMGEVNRDLNGRRGRVLGMDTDGDMQVIIAHVPAGRAVQLRHGAAVAGPGPRLVHGDARPLRRRARATSPRRSMDAHRKESRLPEGTAGTDAPRRPRRRARRQSRSPRRNAPRPNWEATDEEVAARYGVPIETVVRFDLNTRPPRPSSRSG